MYVWTLLLYGSNNAIVNLEGMVRSSVGIHYRARMKEWGKVYVVNVTFVTSP